MKLHLHYFMGLTFLKFGIQMILHFIIYFWLQLFTTLRYHTETLCFHIGNECHWRDNNTGRIFIWPWYYKLINYPAVWTWHLLNNLMKWCEWLHPHMMDPEVWVLPETTYYPLDFDINHN